MSPRSRKSPKAAGNPLLSGEKQSRKLARQLQQELYQELAAVTFELTALERVLQKHRTPPVAMRTVSSLREDLQRICCLLNSKGGGMFAIQ